MPQFTDGTLAVIDDIHDREHASDGYSRYGAYLAHRAHRFHSDGVPLTAAEFAVEAWTTATGPVMSPAYAAVRPDLLAVTAHLGDDDGMFLRIDVPLRHAALTHRPDRRLADWTPDLRSTDRGPYRRLYWPDTNRAALVTTASLIIPVPAHELIWPTTTHPGSTLTREAKDAVRMLAIWANSHAHLVTDLNGGTR
ncbi:hypothetical protein ABZX88_06080 [Kitasatospora aureofaciens]|uniref:hypothetical protein n=1 Tax=Kitasatospora aureofaciens TaxID=1894 RepID=UPI00339F2618